MTTAIYTRVSTIKQSLDSQLPDLKRYVDAQSDLGLVHWYTDKASGKTMDRPGWNRLYDSILAGKIKKLVIWRLDRLGRTASGLCKLFEELQSRNVRLISIKDAIDLGTSSGRLIANVLASVAAYETEVRGERVKAGQLAAKAKGKSWGGSPAGPRKSTTQKKEAMIAMKSNGMTITAIAKSLSLSRQTVRSVLNGPEFI